MTTRSLLIALATGVLLSLLLYYPLAEYLPSRIVADWPPRSGPLAAVLSIASLIMTVAAGWAGARASAAQSRAQAALMGAATGAIAGALLYMAVGGAAAGVWGSRFLLSRGMHPAASQEEFAGVLAQAIYGAHIWSLSGAWLAPLVVGVLSAGGGVATLRGTAQAVPLDFAWLSVCSAGIVGSSIALGLALAVFATRELGLAMQTASNAANLELPSPRLFISGLSLLVATPSLFVWLTIQQKIKRSFGLAAGRAKEALLTAGSIIAAAAGAFFLFQSPSMPRHQTTQMLAWITVALVSLGLLVASFVLQARLRRMWMSRESQRTEQTCLGERAVKSFASGLVFMHAVYAGCLASALTLAVLLVGLIPFLAPRGDEPGPWLWYQSPTEVVRGNYAAHLGFGLAAGVLALLVPGGAPIAGLITRRRARNPASIAAPSSSEHPGAGS